VEVEEVVEGAAGSSWKRWLELEEVVEEVLELEGVVEERPFRAALKCSEIVGLYPGTKKMRG